MNIPKGNSELFLSRTDLCSMEEAIDYAKKVGNDYSTWTAVLKRSDFQNYIRETLSMKDAVLYAKEIEKLYCQDIWKPVVERIDVLEYLSKTLTSTEAISYAKDCEDWRVWEIVMKRDDITDYLLKTLSSIEAVKYANNINYSSIWQIVLSRVDITHREVISYAKEIKYDDKIWTVIFNRDDVKDYLLKTLSPLEAIEYAKEVNYFRIWGFLFGKRNDLPFKESIIAYSKREKQKGYSGNMEYWGNIEFGANGVRNYFKTINPKEIISFAKEVNCLMVWQAALALQKVPSKEAISYAKEIMSKSLWESVLKRKDISKEEAIALAKEIDDSDLWDIVLKKEDGSLL